MKVCQQKMPLNTCIIHDQQKHTNLTQCTDKNTHNINTETKIVQSEFYNKK